MLEEYAGIKLDKRHQRDNWGKRPLSADSLRYAQMDTHYLPYLRDAFFNHLLKLNRLAEAEEAFAEVCDLPAADAHEFDPDGFWKIGQPNSLKRREMLILRELYLLREEFARRRDVPPFKVFTNNTLVALARAMPTSLRSLKSVRGITPRQARRYGREILEAVARSQASTELSNPPRPEIPDPVVSERFAALHTWRKERALQRGVESDVIVSRNTLWDVAHKAPMTLDELQDVRGMGPWRLATYGEEILSVLDECRIPEM
jgi:ribonuclease D